MLTKRENFKPPNKLGIQNGLLDDVWFSRFKKEVDFKLQSASYSLYI